METVWSNITTTPASYSENLDMNLPNIVRLVEDPEIKKEIEFDELSIDYIGGDVGQGGVAQQNKIVGSQYPIIRINDKVFNYVNVINMRISCDSFIPTIDLTVNVVGDVFKDKDLPKDGDIISTFMKTSTDNLNYLRNDFVITSCDFTNNKNSSSNKISVSGKMFIPGIDSNYNVFSIIGTSKTVCKEVAKYFGIGFSYNDDEDTDDFQNWICSGSPEHFIQDVMIHSWKNNDSFFKAWIDLYYDLCFVNVNKFLLSEGQEEIDITFLSKTFLYQGVSNRVTGETENDAEPFIKLFTNKKGFKNTPFFIYKWEVSNNTSISINSGYAEESYMFINNQNLYNSSDNHENCFSILNNISSYDPNKLDTHMILRGRTTYDKNTGEKMARINRDVTSIYINTKWTGISQTLDDDINKNELNTNSWSGNVHKNYNRAPSHNLMNFKELDKMYITIYVDGLCLQVMRGEKVPVLLEHDIAALTKMKRESAMTTDDINKMFSGFYIVDSLEYVYSGKDLGKDRVSPFSTILTLKRREWPTPENIQVDKT